MNTDEFVKFIPVFLEKYKKDGMSKAVIDNTKWIIDHFKKYCLQNNIKNIDMEVIKEFYIKQYDIDIYDLKSSMQSVLRRPLIILMEYYDSGNYLKTHRKSIQSNFPSCYIELYKKIQKEFVDIQNIVMNSKKRKLWYISLFLMYLNDIGIKEIDKLTIETVSNCINKESKRLSKASMHIYKTVLRETLNYLYQENLISFSGRQAFPLIKGDTRNHLLTTYTKEEIAKILNVIDTRTKNGKQAYAIICLIAYYGIRVGDIINFKFEYLDFNKNKINIIQNKTKTNLVLPLIDEVKYALIDYIKNGRHESKDTEYLFTTMYAPFTKFNSTSSIHRILTRIMRLAGINFENKKHGPHSLRHSLATNMLNENVPISAISSILGHSSTLVTERYISVDTTHLRELSLEVPYAI